jgi:hypothetical protein
LLVLSLAACLVAGVTSTPELSVRLEDLAGTTLVNPALSETAAGAAFVVVAELSEAYTSTVRFYLTVMPLDDAGFLLESQLNDDDQLRDLTFNVTALDANDSRGKIPLEYEALFRLSAGKTSLSLVVYVNDDGAAELAENFKVNLRLKSGGVNVVEEDAAFSIAANGNPCGTFTASSLTSSSIAEGTSTKVTVRRVGAALAGAVVGWRVVPDIHNAAATTSDLVVATGNIAFDAGDTGKQVTLTAVRSDGAELEEDFTFELYSIITTGISTSSGGAGGVIDQSMKSLKFEINRNEDPNGIIGFDLVS